MTYRWERLTNANVNMWCGQCIRGRRALCREKGLIWHEDSLSPTSCTRTMSIAGIPIDTELGECVFCSKRNSEETLLYILVWNDVDPRGYAHFCYVKQYHHHHHHYY